MGSARASNHICEFAVVMTRTRGPDDNARHGKQKAEYRPEVMMACARLNGPANTKQQPRPWLPGGTLNSASWRSADGSNFCSHSPWLLLTSRRCSTETKTWLTVVMVGDQFGGFHCIDIAANMGNRRHGAGQTNRDRSRVADAITSRPLVPSGTLLISR